jgi:hypothetical protein
MNRLAYAPLAMLLPTMALAACASDDTSAGGGGSGNATTTTHSTSSTTTTHQGGGGSDVGGGGQGGVGAGGQGGVGAGGQGGVGGVAGNGGNGGSGGVVVPVCGDGALNSADEACDGTDFGSQSCADFGYAKGFLACSADCQTVFATLCYDAYTTCGDGVTEGVFERCDGVPPQPDCTAMGFSGGTTSCSANCEYDFSGCQGDFCDLNSWYGDGYCDPCELLGGTPDPDCATACTADGTCGSYISAFGFTTCVYETGAEDPDCGLCGDGTTDPTEWCDTDDFTASCWSLGYAAGTLACDAACQFDPSGCIGTLACNPVDLGTWSGTIITRPGDSCADGTTIYDANFCAGYYAQGNEIVYQLVVPANTTLRFTQSNLSVDASLYVLADCGRPLTCLAGSDVGGASTESVVLEATNADRTVYVVADNGTAGDCDQFTLTIEEQLPETVCDDWSDNDGDGYFDCADATDCQALPECVPGVTPVGDACLLNTDCTSVTGHDPLCVAEALNPSFINGYCSEFCNLLADDCGSGGLCVNVGWPNDQGLCAFVCGGDADCRQADGYGCQDFGLGSTVCWPL